MRVLVYMGFFFLISSCKSNIYSLTDEYGQSYGYMIQKGRSLYNYVSPQLEARCFKINPDNDDTSDSINKKSYKCPYFGIDQRFKLELVNSKYFAITSSCCRVDFKLDTAYHEISNVPFDDVFGFTHSCVDCKKSQSYKTKYYKDSVLTLQNNHPIDIKMFQIQSNNTSIRMNTIYFGFEINSGVLVYISYTFSNLGFDQKRVVTSRDKRTSHISLKKIKSLLF